MVISYGDSAPPTLGTGRGRRDKKGDGLTFEKRLGFKVPAGRPRRQQCPARRQAKMALHQWNGASSNIRKFTEEERQELREQFSSVSDQLEFINFYPF